uniref:Uncharacterized protein n=1 Tax=Nelumbo nucifera TaxID=4432 RepID=A0A822ZWR8_NELNU|nr:TPA_asm: hypothetical protein HUJ06_004598 [Nelumbo nucifera]
MWDRNIEDEDEVGELDGEDEDDEDADDADCAVDDVGGFSGGVAGSYYLDTKIS